MISFLMFYGNIEGQCFVLFCSGGSCYCFCNVVAVLVCQRQFWNGSEVCFEVGESIIK